MKQFTKSVGWLILWVGVTFIFVDVMILLAGFYQIGIEGQTGYWNPFWKAQAEFLVGIIN